MSFLPELGTWNHRNKATFHHTITTGTSGAIASQDAAADSGIVAVKTATKTGRYTLTVPAKYRKFRGGHVIALGPTDATYGAKTKGSIFFFRNNNLDTGSGPFTVDVQAMNPSTDATNQIDSEVPDGTVLYITLHVMV